jgi:hypothetical protein
LTQEGTANILADERGHEKCPLRDFALIRGGLFTLPCPCEKQGRDRSVPADHQVLLSGSGHADRSGLTFSEMREGTPPCSSPENAVADSAAALVCEKDLLDNEKKGSSNADEEDENKGDETSPSKRWRTSKGSIDLGPISRYAMTSSVESTEASSSANPFLTLQYRRQVVNDADTPSTIALTSSGGSPTSSPPRPVQIAHEPCEKQCTSAAACMEDNGFGKGGETVDDIDHVTLTMPGAFYAGAAEATHDAFADLPVIDVDQVIDLLHLWVSLTSWIF